jgi:hypothetical protein
MTSNCYLNIFSLSYRHQLSQVKQIILLCFAININEANKNNLNISPLVLKVPPTRHVSILNAMMNTSSTAEAGH